MKLKTSVVTETDIAAWMEGTLEEGRRRQLELLLSEDSRLFDEILTLRRIVRSPDSGGADFAPASCIRDAIAMYQSGGFVDIVLGLVDGFVKILSHGKDIGFGYPQAIVPVRTSSASQPGIVIIRKSFGDFEGELDVETTTGGGCTIRVIMPDTVPGQKGRMRAELISSHRIIASELLSSGRAVFDGLGTGIYRIVFRTDHKDIGDITIKIADASGE